ncbi:hypothetical protein [Pseudomonas sp. SIMBA_021]|uniref:hypothetical protein n=1 Tax=unclassified Pseudomonas TaxID=196821 RepID=UPI00397C7C31
MKKFSMPPGMKVASVWVVWAFLAIGGLGWALFVVLDAFGAKEKAADWAQAAGSILAIIGAAAFPIFHSKKNAEESQSQTDTLLMTVATLIGNELDMLINSLLGNIQPDQELASEIFRIRFRTPHVKPPVPSKRLCDAAVKSARQYARHGHIASWSGLDTLLTNISSAHMATRHHLIHLNHLMNAISAAKAACKMLRGWSLASEDALPMVNRLIFCHQNVVLAIDYLSGKRQLASQ